MSFKADLRLNVKPHSSVLEMRCVKVHRRMLDIWRKIYYGGTGKLLTRKGCIGHKSHTDNANTYCIVAS